MQRNKHHCKLLEPPEERKESMPRKEMRFSAITYPFLNADEMINRSMMASGGVNFHLLIRELKNCCHYFWQRPLLLSKGILQDQRSQSPDKNQIMCRSCKGLSQVSINNSTEINEKFVFACLHTGTDHSHLDSYLNIVGLWSISSQNVKGIERKVGKEIKQVAGESWKKWKKAELEKEKTGPQQEKLKGSFWWILEETAGIQFCCWTWSYLWL